MRVFTVEVFPFLPLPWGLSCCDFHTLLFKLKWANTSHQAVRSITLPVTMILFLLHQPLVLRGISALSLLCSVFGPGKRFGESKVKAGVSKAEVVVGAHRAASVVCVASATPARRLIGFPSASAATEQQGSDLHVPLLP